MGVLKLETTKPRDRFFRIQLFENKANQIMTSTTGRSEKPNAKKRWVSPHKMRSSFALHTSVRFFTRVMDWSFARIAKLSHRGRKAHMWQF